MTTIIPPLLNQDTELVKPEFSKQGFLWIVQFKLYQQVYFAVVTALALLVSIIFVLQHYVVKPITRNTSAYVTLSQIVQESLPPLTAPVKEQAAAVQVWINRLHGDFALYGSDRKLIFGGGSRILSAPPISQIKDGWIAGDEEVYAALLPDKRWLLSTMEAEDTGRHIAIGATLLISFLLVGVGIFPVIRKITRRLEELQSSVSLLGEGNLAVRAEVNGADEVANLAHSFNKTASQLQALVQSQKSLLANASHELRTPLARIQMAMGLMGTDQTELAMQEISQSVRDLDQLVEEILLASRLESGRALPARKLELIDLPSFLRTECERYGATVDSVQLTVVGDSILLTRLLKNLLENATRYGKGSPIHVSATIDLADTDWLEICVKDGGPGVPISERERIFEPFYRLHGASEGGVGLGLSLVRSIAQLHGGTVYCKDNEGIGSSFIIRLPRTDL